MKTLYRWLKGFVVSHKILTTILILGVGFAFISMDEKSQVSLSYETVTVEEGVLISTVSGTGQVQAANEFALKSEVSGDVIYVGAQEGEYVDAGTLLLRLDDTDAQKNVRDAQVSLESAQLSLQKLLEPESELTLLQATNDIAQAQEDIESSKADLEKEYEDGFNVVADAFLDLPGIMAGFETILYTTSINNNQDNIAAYENAIDEFDTDVMDMKDGVNDAYQSAREAYDTTFELYDSLSRFSSHEEVSNLVDYSYETVKIISEAVKTTNNYIDHVEDVLIKEDRSVFSAVSTHQASLAVYTGQINSHLSSLLNIQNGIIDAHEAINNAQRDLEEKEVKLTELEAGTDELDIQSQQLSVKQKEYALADANDHLANYYIYAPFGGIVSNIEVQRYETINSNASVATILTEDKTVVVSFNEVDVSAIEKGQRATFVFDALEGVTAVGEVVEIDTVGTVSQGVVSYDVTISFESEDDRIKPGMSAEVTIVVEVLTDVISVPSAAVKSSGDDWKVQILAEEGGQYVVTDRQVEVGVSNDTHVEIVSGIEVGERVVTKTVEIEEAEVEAQQQTSILPMPGQNRNK